MRVSEEPIAAAEGSAPATAESAEQGAQPPDQQSPDQQSPDQQSPDQQPPEQQPAEQQPPDPWQNARLPWEGKPRRVDIACWAAITLSGLYYFALLPFRASLVGTHPLLSVLLNGSTEAIVSAAAFAKVGHGSIVVVLLASIPGLIKFDIIYWWAGRLWGERVIQIFSGRGKRSQKFVARVNRSGRWLTWPAVVLSPFLPIPDALVYAAAGWTGMSWVTFLVLDAIGNLMWAGLLAGLGWALGQHAVNVAQEISKYGLWFSIAIVVLVVASQMRGARARAS